MLCEKNIASCDLSYEKKIDEGDVDDDGQEKLLQKNQAMLSSWEKSLNKVQSLLKMLQGTSNRNRHS